MHVIKEFIIYFGKPEAFVSLQVSECQADLDKLYNKTFARVKFYTGEQRKKTYYTYVTESSFGELGRLEPESLQALIDAVGTAKWAKFQSELAPIKLRLTRLTSRLEELRSMELS